MANVNLNNLNNIEPLNLTFGNFTTMTGATNELKDITINSVGNFWFIASILLIFIILAWWFYRPDKTFLLDMTRSILISSSWCIFISIAFLLSGWINTVVPIVWFATIFTISVVASMKLKAKGL